MCFDFLKNEFDIDFTSLQKQKCEKFIALFKEYNSHTNLMSKNDLNFIFEKHIVDSLAVNLFKDFSPKTLLDIGTGGGFPSVPISIFFENVQVLAIDSIQKKIRFLQSVKQELNIQNFSCECKRSENLDKKYLGYFDVVTSRALADLKTVVNYSSSYIKNNGFLISYKSKNYKTEIEEAKNVLAKKHLKQVAVLDYKLPMGEDFERYLLIFKKSVK